MSPSRQDREAAVRDLLEGPPATVPPELYSMAMRRGHRLLHRRKTVRRALWVLLCAAVAACAVWAAVDRPWSPPPSDTTPSFTQW
ncbi:hypothetical protein [Streptomyces odontomachi]|uniref:hypothetical protein n=1 Tax=Streptomyces odontomachi TaxID=2944940 RepID=UPI00210DC0C4|nr:hypothetical protein [Streptomyces sp. ODS25]